ncbi:MAG: RsmD family RNA methyltransferase [Synergistaceae bacterium]|nr:RsmD family RNA methyltransferase [Synergistaceae bacterium]
MKDVRPTSGRVLLALFNILGDINGAKFLDLFAGTGHVGLAALERGAESCVFVESVKQRAEEIKNKIPDNSLVLSLEVRRAIAWLVKREKKFNIIFADPPYNSGWCDSLPALQNLNKLFENDEAIFIIEHSTREPLTLKNNPHDFKIFSQREYGETCLSFLKK